MFRQNDWTNSIMQMHHEGLEKVWLGDYKWIHRKDVENVV
jgi:hypothetical protein